MDTPNSYYLLLFKSTSYTIPIVIVIFNTAGVGLVGSGPLKYAAYRITKDRYTLIEQSVEFYSVNCQYSYCISINNCNVLLISLLAIRCDKLKIS